MLAEQENASQFLDFLIIRIRTFLSDTRMNAVVGDSGALTLERWLTNYVCDKEARDIYVNIVDLSLVPTEVVHVVTAVIARMVFEALQRYLKLNHAVLPTVLVMEEAHTFIKRYKDDVEYYDAATVCCQVFERIAREGRKFGLGLVLSSQRPSELSQTVLSQCNTFLLHRISNDRDQELVSRLVPDNLRGLLRELPSLPSQNAILLGWASELPLLVKMKDLPRSHQPRSDDPDFWNVWTGKDAEGNVVERKCQWKSWAEDWQGHPPRIRRRPPCNITVTADADRRVSPLAKRRHEPFRSWMGIPLSCSSQTFACTRNLTTNGSFSGTKIGLWSMNGPSSTSSRPNQLDNRGR
jgi:hypothetical protein